MIHPWDRSTSRSRLTGVRSFTGTFGGALGDVASSTGLEGFLHIGFFGVSLCHMLPARNAELLTSYPSAIADDDAIGGLSCRFNREESIAKGSRKCSVKERLRQ